jgi:thiamine kinase-like enzyme
MNEAEQEHVRRKLVGLPGFHDRTARAVRIEPLRGLTNRVYLVEGPGGRFTLRIPGAGSAAIIDRRKEETNARIAAEIGVAPEVLYFDVDGVMLTPFTEGIPLSAARFKEQPSAIARAAQALRSLHDSRREFSGIFDVFSVNAAYIELLAERGYPVSKQQHLLAAKTQPIREVLIRRARPLRPCHCDPTGANLIDTGSKVWLIDWEYSAMNDPMWDLAYLSLQSGFDDEQDATLLAAYHGGQPVYAEVALMEVFKALVELLSALWALVQQSAGNRSGDFESYAAATFSRYGERVSGERFHAAVASLPSA